MLIDKGRRKVWGEIVRRSHKFKIYSFLYRSYWHSLYSRKEKQQPIQAYFSAIPNKGAGIGHQMANWIAGYWWAMQFELEFAHIPFSTSEWETFLGFGEGEKTVAELIKKGYKKRTLPRFNEKRIEEVERTAAIIKSYNGQKVVFICEQDQFYKDQFGVIENIQYKFYNANARNADKLVYSAANYNIAIHVRRGDIVIGQENQNPNLLMRWQNNDYFVNVLANVLTFIKADKPVSIYLFSQGDKSDFEDFKRFPNLNFCLDMNAQDSFLHMVYSDLLITSKSSFSYKPALLNRGIKVCPKDFWHSYPNTKDWILADEDGTLDL